MTGQDRIKDEKLQYVINRETEEILVLSLRKNDVYWYVLKLMWCLTGEEILPCSK